MANFKIEVRDGVDNRLIDGAKVQFYQDTQYPNNPAFTATGGIWSGDLQPFNHRVNSWADHYNSSGLFNLDPRTITSGVRVVTLSRVKGYVPPAIPPSPPPTVTPAGSAGTGSTSNNTSSNPVITSGISLPSWMPQGLGGIALIAGAVILLTRKKGRR